MRKRNKLLAVGVITSLCFSMEVRGPLSIFAATDLESQYQQDVNESKDASMSVYGEFVYPEVVTSKAPDEISDNPIRINLEWGSLKYKYTSGNYDNRTSQYKEGIWTAEKTGASDIIHVINNSDTSIRADITYVSSNADEGNFLNICGEFEDCKEGYSEFGSISLRDIYYGRDKEVRFGLVGAPQRQVKNNVSQEIGKIIVTVSREDSYPPCSEAPSPAPMEYPCCSEAPSPAPTEYPCCSEAPSPAPTEYPYYSEAPYPSSYYPYAEPTV